MDWHLTHWEELLQSVSNFIFRLIISKHCGRTPRGVRGVKRSEIYWGIQKYSLPGRPSTHHWVKSKTIIEKHQKLRKKIINQLLVNFLPPKNIFWFENWIFMHFLMVFDFTQFWLDGRPGNEYFWIPHKISDLLIPLTPLGVRPQWFETYLSRSSYSATGASCRSSSSCMPRTSNLFPSHYCTIVFKSEMTTFCLSFIQTQLWNSNWETLLGLVCISVVRRCNVKKIDVLGLS